MAVGPQIGLALQHEDEFLLIGLGMGPRDTPTGLQPFMVDAEPHQAELSAIRGADCLELVRALIVVVILAFDVAPMGDEGREIDRPGHVVESPSSEADDTIPALRSG